MNTALSAKILAITPVQPNITKVGCVLTWEGGEGGRGGGGERGRGGGGEGGGGDGGGGGGGGESHFIVRLCRGLSCTYFPVVVRVRYTRTKRVPWYWG